MSLLERGERAVRLAGGDQRPVTAAEVYAADDHFADRKQVGNTLHRLKNLGRIQFDGHGYRLNDTEAGPDSPSSTDGDQPPPAAAPEPPAADSRERPAPKTAPREDNHAGLHRSSDSNGADSREQTGTHSIPLAESVAPSASAAGQVGHQAHYESCAIQPIDFIVANRMDFLEGNVIKYVARYRRKNGVEDLEKARQYLDWLIDRETAGVSNRGQA